MKNDRILRNAYNRVFTKHSVSADENFERHYNTRVRDEKFYDSRTDEYIVTGKRDLVEFINGTVDAHLTPHDRVVAFQNGDYTALSVDNSGIYTDLTGAPTNVHELVDLLHRARTIAHDTNDSRDLKKAVDDLIKPNEKGEIEDEQK